MRSLSDYRLYISQIRANRGNNHPLVIIIIRYIVWIINYRSFSDFFNYKLYEKGSRIRSYLSLHKFLRIHNRLNPPQYKRILEDKYIFDRFFSSFDYPLAKITGYIANGKVHYLSGKTLPVDELLDLDLNCFIKSNTKWGGLGVHKLEIINKSVYIDNKETGRAAFHQLIKDDLFIIQDTIVQHPEMQRICPDSVNTLRMVTIHNGDESFNFFNYLRMGVGGSVVDNITSGGLGCGIDENGILFDLAFNGTGIFASYQHPKTGIKFNGFKIPYYHESLNLVRKMHNSLHCIFIIGWDIAITLDGPVVIEGNPVAGLNIEQQIFGGMKDKFLLFAKQYEMKRKYIK